jgi:hypothetical protein
MKRGILLIVMLLLLVDLAEDGCLGKVKFGPLQAAVSTSFSNFHHYPTGQLDSTHSLPSPDWPDMSGSRQFQLVTQMGQLALKIMSFCNHGSSGGIPR